MEPLVWVRLIAEVIVIVIGVAGLGLTLFSAGAVLLPGPAGALLSAAAERYMKETGSRLDKDGISLAGNSVACLAAVLAPIADGTEHGLAHVLWIGGGLSWMLTAVIIAAVDGRSRTTRTTLSIIITFVVGAVILLTFASVG